MVTNGGPRPGAAARWRHGPGEALRDAGAGRANVGATYRLAVGLRWHVVLGTIRTWLDPTAWQIRGSRPDEPRTESLRHLVRLARHILDAGEV